MAIEHINEFDTLNAGREKINKHAIDPANRAELNSIDAKSVANQANQTSQNAEAIAINTDDRLDNIIAGEMQDAEVIDARKPFAGSAYPNLGKRLDAAETEAYRLATRTLIPVTDFGITADGVSDDTDKLQALVDVVDADGLPYFYLPTYYQNYLLSKMVSFANPDIRIFGDKGIQMSHPSEVPTKNGDIYIANTAIAAFDLGARRSIATSKNPAGSWVVEGLSFKTAPGDSPRRSNGIELSGMQNGPDRLILITKCSFVGLKNPIYMPAAPSGVSIMAANLKIIDCTAYQSDIAIKIDGPVYGATITNNNLEGGVNGCVHGIFNGFVNISENMLENTKNPINIGVDLGASMRLVSQGNYFEHHPTSDYLYYLDLGVYYIQSDVEINKNIVSSPLTMQYPIVLTGDARVMIDNPQFPVLFKKSRAKVVRGSNLIGKQGHYAFDQLGGNAKYTNETNMIVYVDGGLNMTDIANKWNHHKVLDGGLMTQTPIGQARVVDLADGFIINQALNNTNQLLIVNLMLMTTGDAKINDENAHLFLNTQDGNYFNHLPDAATQIAKHMSAGKWCLVSIPIVVKASVSSIKLKVEEKYRGEFFVAGATTKIINNYKNDGTDEIVKIYPVRPNI